MQEKDWILIWISASLSAVLTKFLPEKISGLVGNPLLDTVIAALILGGIILGVMFIGLRVLKIV